MGKVWKQQMYPQYTTYYYPQYLQAAKVAKHINRCQERFHNLLETQLDKVLNNLI